MTPDAIEQFWVAARPHTDASPLPGYLGSTPAEVVAPPTWAFGDSSELADELLSLVLTGTKTATASAERDYLDAGEAIPTVGDLAIVLDGSGQPRALLRTEHVAVVAFEDVDAEHARLEGEGDRSLAHWRETHRAYFTRTGDGTFDPRMPVVLERFKMLYR